MRRSGTDTSKLSTRSRRTMGCGKKHSNHIKIRNHSVEITDLDLVPSSRFLGPSSIGMDVNFVNYENVYGIPEHADAFSLRSTQWVCLVFAMQAEMENFVLVTPIRTVCSISMSSNTISRIRWLSTVRYPTCWLISKSVISLWSIDNACRSSVNTLRLASFGWMQLKDGLMWTMTHWIRK